MCSNEIFKLIKIYSDLTCAKYGGIQKDDAGCAASCGTCGGDRGSLKPGGESNCCIGDIPLQKVCGPGQVAPCHLVSKGKRILSKSYRAIYKIADI